MRVPSALRAPATPRSPCAQPWPIGHSRVRAGPARHGVPQHGDARAVERRPARDLGAAADDDARPAQGRGDVRHAGVVADHALGAFDQRAERPQAGAADEVDGARRASPRPAHRPARLPAAPPVSTTRGRCSASRSATSAKRSRASAATAVARRHARRHTAAPSRTRATARECLAVFVAHRKLQMRARRGSPRWSVSASSRSISWPRLRPRHVQRPRRRPAARRGRRRSRRMRARRKPRPADW